MKKSSAITCVISMALLLLAGCGREDRQRRKEPAEINMPWLYSLEVYSNAVNPENIYHAAYPYCFYGFTSDRDGNRETGRFDLADRTEIKELMQEEESFQYFIRYAEGLPENQEGKDLSYHIRYRQSPLNSSQKLSGSQMGTCGKEPSRI